MKERDRKEVYATGVNRRQEILSVLAIFLPLEVMILSLERAEWLDSQPSLSLVLAVSVLTGYILTKIKLHKLLKWLVVIILGIIITGWQVLTILPPSVLPWPRQLFEALQSTVSVISMSGTETSNIHFAVFLLVFTWVFGSVSSWLVLQKHNAWPVVIAGTIVLLINLSNLPLNYYGFLFFFLGASLLLIGQTRIIKNRTDVREPNILTRNRSVKYFLTSVICISVLVSFTAWLLPDVKPGKFFYINRGNTPILERVEDYLVNFFSAVPRKQPLIAAEEQVEFTFETTVERYGSDLHFIIASETPQYWRMRMYDVYTSTGWTNSESSQYSLNEFPEIRLNPGTENRETITFNVETALQSDVILTTGEFVSVNLPAYRHVLSSKGIPETGSVVDNTVTVTSAHTLDTEQKYTVRSSVISASPAELADAGEDYPEWIISRYLQLPDSLPENVVFLTTNVTANATTPYEKALAINRYLADFRYNRNTQSPPEDTDAVEYFLFTKQSGACGDFASAMTVMLRAVGVPARFSTGYSPGELDSESGKYFILQSNRHAWSEVYFPGYGWIEYEATPGSDFSRGIIGVEAVTFSGGTEIWDPMLHMQQYMVPSDVQSRAVIQQPADTTTLFLLWPILLLVLAIAIVVIIIIGYFNRDKNRKNVKSGDKDYASEAYGGMCELATQAGIGPLPYQTPYEYIALLTAEFPYHAEYIKVILNNFLKSRYGAGENVPESANWELMKARRIVFDAIRSRVSRKL